MPELLQALRLPLHLIQMRSSDLNLLEVLLLRVQIDDSDVPMTESEINFLAVYICNPILAGV
jgi:hypothetical protein